MVARRLEAQQAGDVQQETGQNTPAQSLLTRPADLAKAYNIDTTINATGATIALIDAYGYSTLEADLAVVSLDVRGLPACTSGERLLEDR